MCQILSIVPFIENDIMGWRVRGPDGKNKYNLRIKNVTHHDTTPGRDE